jgi:[CysO sulfur-carrier protein]-S-L-cysteine hydrolase
MLVDVQRRSPEEACGLIAGKDGRAEKVILVSNELKSPVRFRMDPQEQWLAFKSMEEAELDLIGIYHSHPSGPAGPSSIDVAEAAYPGITHLIWFPDQGEWDYRAFLIEEGLVEEVPVTILTDTPE